MVHSEARTRLDNLTKIQSSNAWISSWNAQILHFPLCRESVLTRLYGKELMFNILITFILLYLSRLMTKPIKWHVHPAKTQINLGIRPVRSESSLSTWGKLKSLAIIRAHSEASDQTGWKPRLIWVFAGRKGHFVGFVMRLLLCLASPILISAISRRFISWNSPRKGGFLCIRAHVCLRLLCHTADE